MKTTQILSGLAATLPALIAPVAASSDSFTGVAIRSGSPIQYASINANDGNFWLNKNTSTYTPSSVSAPSNPATVFSGNQIISLDVAVPGGQQVYVATTGELAFTTAHSADLHGGVATGFQINGNNELQFEAAGWMACAEDDAYKVYWSGNATKEQQDDCLGFAFLTSATDADGAYEYA